MDAATAAAVAALVVSVLAMTIATAQVLQQYLNTGLLIRMCDSVVYGKMPGQGRRVWQYSQFRFRVIYSVPQVCLRPSLWKASLPHHENYERGLLPLPDLRHKAELHPARPKYLSEKHPGERTRLAHSPVPGEACWVSLCRAAQHSCTSDLFYDLHHCDADRCPSDLPVVPMQVSMRDIVVIALMAGMKCTDASFEGKSIAMDGEAGTITSSWHPMLGSIIHFSPRNIRRPLGIQIRAGSIEPAWMARMWDIATIAGRRYDARDRKIYELYEGHSWVATSRGRSMVKAVPLKPPNSRSPVRSFRLRSTSPARVLRRRNTAHPSNVTHSMRGTSAPTTSYHVGNGSVMAQSRTTASPNPEVSRQAVGGGQPNTQDDILIQNHSFEGAKTELRKRNVQKNWLLPWRGHLRTFLSRKLADSPMASTHQIPNEHTTDIEGYGGVVNATTQRIPPQDEPSLDDLQDIDVGNLRATANPNGNWFPTASGTASGQRRMLDGGVLQQYIKEKQQVEQTMPRGRNLFITWRPPSREEESRTTDFQQDWQASLMHSRRERSSSLVDKWREVLNSRQQMRQARDTETEWEVESYHSASRQSSTIASDRRRRFSPSQVRSFSRDSHSSKRSVQGSAKNFQRKHGCVADREESSQHGHRQSPPPKTSSLRSVSRESYINYSYGREPIEIGENNDKTQSARYPAENVNQTPYKPDPEAETQLKGASSRGKRVHYTEVSAPDDEFGRRKDGEDIDVSQQLNSIVAVPVALETVGQPAIVVESLQDIPRKRGEESTRAPSSMITEPPRSILRPPREQFPDEPEPWREGVAPLVKPGLSEGRPSNARWTKIARRLVNPEALERAGERFEVSKNSVIVLRVLTRQEIMDLAESTKEIREAREREWNEMTERQEVESMKARTSNHPEDEPAQKTTDQILPVDAACEPVLSVGPGTEDASSSINWSSQSVYGSGGESKISHSPDTMSETEEPRRGRDTLLEPKRSDKTSDATRKRGISSAVGEAGSNRSMSPRQALAAQWEERLKANGQPPRRRASTRSQSSSSGESSSGSDSSDEDSIRIAGVGDVNFKSHPFRRREIPQHDDSDDVQQSTTMRATIGDGTIKWLWICQVDVLPGYFANPWHDYFSRETCLGAIVTVLESLEYYTDSSTLAYVDALPWCEHWLRRGQHTHPSYAINAMGGVIIPGDYHFVKARGWFVVDVFINCLTTTPYTLSPKTKIPWRLLLLRLIQEAAHWLLGSYHRQIDPSNYQGSDALVVESLAELMALDSWLSFCGRQPEIYDGRNNLLQSMPMLIQKLMSDFEFEFSSLDRTSADGGHQIVKELAGLIAHTLEKALLSEEEQLFTMMAMLRAAKMALCLLNGPTTAKLRDIFLRDVQVYLV